MQATLDRLLYTAGRHGFCGKIALLLNIDNSYFDGMVEQIYPSELQLNKANSSDTEAPFLDLHLTISDGFVSSKFIINVTILMLIL